MNNLSIRSLAFLVNFLASKMHLCDKSIEMDTDILDSLWPKRWPYYLAADKMAIMDVVYKYCRAIDRLDRELLESVFHEDSIHHHGEYKGPSAQFCDFAFDILEKIVNENQIYT